MTLILYAFIPILVVTSGIFWLGLNIPHLVSDSTSILEWCRDLLTTCLSYFSVGTALLLWTGAVVLGAGMVYALVKAGFSMLKSYRAVRRLPLADQGLSVLLIRDDTVRVAFTYGLIRTRIYVSTGFLGALSREEVRSVLLHEIHHRRSRDPLKAFLATLLKDVFFYIPVGGFLESRRLGIREMEADDAVVRKTGKPLEFAETLIKVAGFGVGIRVDAAVASFRGYGGLEKRIKRLLDGAPPAEKGLGRKTVLSSVLIAAFMLVSVALPLANDQLEKGLCDTDHCSTHAYEVRDDCRVHCDITG